MIRIIAFLENLLAGRKLFDASAFDQQREVLWRKLIPKRMPGENIFESFHDYFRIFVF
jgi:hypothetical protein